MDNVIQAIERYLEFLILGGLAIGLLAIPFGPRILKVWTAAWAAHVPPAVSGPAKLSDERPAPARLQTALQGGVLFGVTFMLGFLISDLGAWALQPSHLEVISRTQTFVCTRESALNPLDPNPGFWLTPLHHFGRLEPNLYDALRWDDQRQQYWQIYKTASYNDALGSSMKQIRFVRGLVFLSLSAALVLLLVAIARGAKRIRSWRVCLLGGALSLSAYVVLMGAYWTIEANVHRQVWAAKFFGESNLDEVANIANCDTTGR
jgi:hypothetical protein